MDDEIEVQLGNDVSSVVCILDGPITRRLIIYLDPFRLLSLDDIVEFAGGRVLASSVLLPKNIDTSPRANRTCKALQVLETPSTRSLSL